VVDEVSLAAFVLGVPFEDVELYSVSVPCLGASCWQDLLPVDHWSDGAVEVADR